MKSARRDTTVVLFVACLVLVHICAAQQDNCIGHCGNPSTWEGFNSFTLKMTTTSTSEYSYWQGHFDKDTNDIQVIVETSEAGKVVKGKLLMIEGRVMAVQGPITEPGYEIDAMDAPVLQLQLVFKLLDRVLPNGPPSVQSTKKSITRTAKLQFKSRR